MGIVSTRGMAALAADTLELTEREQEIFRQDFDSFDTNNDGIIDATELQGLLRKQLNRDPTDFEVEATMTMFDTDKDGNISFSEYMQHIVGDAWKGYAAMMSK